MDVGIHVPCHLPQLRSGQRLQPEPKQGWNPALAPGQMLHPTQYQEAVEGWREIWQEGSFHGWEVAAWVKLLLPGEEGKVKPGME